MAAAVFKPAVLALFCAACTGIAADDRTFEGTEWQVTAIDAQEAPGGDTYRVTFRNGQFGGRFGCNSFSGAYQVRDGTTLIVGPVGATEMACEGLAMNFESRGFQVLQQPMVIDWAGSGRLTLSNGAGSISLRRVP